MQISRISYFNAAKFIVNKTCTKYGERYRGYTGLVNIIHMNLMYEMYEKREKQPDLRLSCSIDTRT